MAQLTIDLTGRAGLAPKFGSDINSTTTTPHRRYKGAPGQMASGVYNPFRYDGYMSPATNASQTITFSGDTRDNNLAYWVYDPVNDDIYFAEKGENLWRGDGWEDGSFTKVASITSGGVSTTIKDIELYPINGVDNILCAYDPTDGSAAGIAIQAVNGGALNLTWLTSTATGAFGLTKGNDYKMRVADNGFLYVLDGNALHKIDGVTQTATQNVLKFNPRVQLTDAIDYRGKFYIAVTGNTSTLIAKESFKMHTNECGVYIWDRFSTVVRMNDYIIIPGIREIRRIYISPLGDLRAITVAANGMVQIRSFTGSAFKVIQEVDLYSYPTQPDSLVVGSNITYWLGADGFLYAHGSFDPSEPEGLYRIAQYVSTASIITGVLAHGGFTLSGGSDRTDREGFYWAWDNTSTELVEKFYLHGDGTITSVSQIPHVGDVFTLVNFLPEMSTIRDVNIRCLQTTSTTDTVIATVKFYFNQSSTASITKTITDTEASRGYVTFDLNKPYVNAIQIEIEWQVAAAIGVNDFYPSVAIVDYEPTTTQSPDNG